MDLLIANDSGPVHMAVAVGTPSLVIFGPTDPMRTGPFGRQHRIEHADLDCRPCYERTCPRGHTQCVRAVTPHQVLTSALEMLDRIGGAVE
jgi:ADP-heptose:LPS heptosyltransferase